MIARVLRGGECPEPGQIHHRQASEHWALALSKGLESPAPKHDPNEDACGVVSSGMGVVAVVADAHFGRLSAELVVDYLLSLAMQEPLPRGCGAVAAWGWLAAGLETANRRIRAQDTTSACAVLAVVVQGRSLWWSSVGDCRLYRVHSDGVTVCNPLRGVYLGDRGLVDPEQGECVLEPGDRIVLASDGLPECRYGRETLLPATVGARVRGEPAEAAAIALIQEALLGGGEDNIAVVVGVV